MSELWSHLEVGDEPNETWSRSHHCESVGTRGNWGNKSPDRCKLCVPVQDLWDDGNAHAQLEVHTHHLCWTLTTWEIPEWCPDQAMGRVPKVHCTVLDAMHAR
jgi:hypothetical protein